jgi:hypothetical protein
MRLTPINSAEAVFAPSFDERLGELASRSGAAPGALCVHVRLFLNSPA